MAYQCVDRSFPPCEYGSSEAINTLIGHHPEARKFGKDRKGNQRFQCTECCKTFSDVQEKPLGEMRIPMEDAVRCLHHLLEGVSVRATARLTGINRGTILDLMVMMGERCELLLEGRITRTVVADVQCDEIWGFVGMKEKTRLAKHPTLTEVGDAYCFTAIERETKLMLAWHLGTRTNEDTKLFAQKLAAATTGRFQITTDGFSSYKKEIPAAFPDCDFAQLIKEYAIIEGQKYASGKYSPAVVNGITKKPVNGDPDEDKICTSHVERANLTIRMQNRRMTRLTNAFSKKWENHALALALQFAFYNFCRPHMTLSKSDKDRGIVGVKTTPAMKAGITDHVWTIEELVRESSTH